MPQRRRTPTDALDAANRKTDEQFVEEYLRSTDPDTLWVTTWTHPRSNQTFTLQLLRSENLSDGELQACFDLIAETSEADYRTSSVKWRPDKKLKEMKSAELRYILVRDGEGAIGGFTSLMPTYEEGQPVVYCYEIHLKPEMRGTGLGELLMGFHSTVAKNLPPITKVMLTCFLANERGLDFYRKLGFETDEISPRTRRLRTGEIQPDYVILSKPVRNV
ncbi:acyl-CoA N-acyltransferase [Phialemonium atrogriseum]|uniref:N-alpha-acetyltransferase 40 n=1 Tax=Phialemonium atrogriseum TaxID=1093897 RepID=A0AAJ0FHF1_9PEZI|nr:acyl-CoA N-acyltransferase [Phialemonium atrogriseum]KAK1762104.1 acyl-CoA N-acyltransferase [Phialemonium atrogriseum]